MCYVPLSWQAPCTRSCESIVDLFFLASYVFHPFTLYPTTCFYVVRMLYTLYNLFLCCTHVLHIVQPVSLQFWYNQHSRWCLCVVIIILINYSQTTSNQWCIYWGAFGYAPNILRGIRPYPLYIEGHSAMPLIYWGAFGNALLYIEGIPSYKKKLPMAIVRKQEDVVWSSFVK